MTSIPLEDFKRLGQPISIDGQPPIQTIQFACMEFDLICEDKSALQIKYMIQTVLLSLECVSIKRYDDASWTFIVEYGTKPEHIEKYKEVGGGFMRVREDCAIEAAQKSAKMFPHNHSTKDDFETEFGGAFDIKKWCLCEFGIRRRRQCDQYLLNMTITAGHHPSSWHIFRELKNRLTANEFI